MSEGLLGGDRLSVVFKPGQTALGHRWILRDADEQEIGKTKLFYEGSEKSVGRLLRVTGLSTKGDLHAHVLDADGNEHYRLHSTNSNPKRVEVTDAEDRPLGATRREDTTFELLAPGSDAVVGRIGIRDRHEDMAFPVEDAAGTRLAVLSKVKVEMKGTSLYDDIFFPELSANQAAFAATMHLGFAFSREYHLLVEQRPDREPLLTLLALTPLLAAYSY